MSGDHLFCFFHNCYADTKNKTCSILRNFLCKAILFYLIVTRYDGYIFMQLNHIELKTNWNNHRNRKVAHMKFNNGLSKWLCMKSYTYSLDVTNRRKDLVKWNMTGFWAFLFYYCINNNNETYFTFFPLFLLLVNHFTFIHFVAMIIIFFHIQTARLNKV